MSYQAQLKDGIAFAVTQTADAQTGPNFVPLASLDASVIGKRWIGSAWQDVPVGPAPQPLDEAALIDLCQSAGGMTDAMLVSVYDDPQLKAFVIKLRASRAILPTDARTVQGLGALEALGYLPEGAGAVIAAWPTA